MKKVGIFFATESGATRRAAELIQKQFGVDVADVHNIAFVEPLDLQKYRVLIFGTPTTELGGLPKAWEEFIERFAPIDLSQQSVALFGLGDQKHYPDEFLNGMRILYHWVREMGAVVVGDWAQTGYEFSYSAALIDGRFVGLGLDEDTQRKMSEARVETWVRMLRDNLRRAKVLSTEPPQQAQSVPTN